MFKIIYLKKYICMMQNQFAILQIVNKNLIPGSIQSRQCKKLITGNIVNEMSPLTIYIFVFNYSYQIHVL
jgi:hypothetical protein